jgi:hypothetical protein
MRKSVKMLCATLVPVAIIMLLVTFSAAPPPAVPSTESPVETKALAFIENVLPIDISHYNVTLKTSGPLFLNSTGVVKTYSLGSDESTLDVICTIENNVLRSCMVYVKNGSVISDRSYASINDAITSFS